MNTTDGYKSLKCIHSSLQLTAAIYQLSFSLPHYIQPKEEWQNLILGTKFFIGDSVMQLTTHLSVVSALSRISPAPAESHLLKSI